MKSLLLALVVASALAAQTSFIIQKAPAESFNAGANFSQVASADGITLVSTVQGTLTSGSFTITETATQTGTGATGTVEPGTWASALLIQNISGTPNESGVWTGSTSGAVFTPTSVPEPVTATLLTNNTDVSSTFVASSPAPQVATSVTINGVATPGQYVIFRLQGGTNNQRAVLNINVTDNVTGELWTGQITVYVISGTGH
jgi:hypothetical protein